MKKILVIGSLNIDWAIEVDHTPVTGETLLSKSFEEAPGGKGANQACACGKLGGNVSMLGVVGNDKQADILIKNLSDVNVNITKIKKVQDTATGMAIIYINRDGNNSIVVLSGANEKCSIDYIDENIEMIKTCDIVILQMEIPYKTVEYIVNVASKFEKTIILNPAPAPESISNDMLSKLDYITPNQTELKALTGFEVETLDQVKMASEALLLKGIKNVLVTLGSDGALFINNNECAHFDVAKVKAVDTTGAGDSFIGAFATYLAEGKAVHEAIEFANKVATITIMKKGASPAIPTRAMVDNWNVNNI